MVYETLGELVDPKHAALLIIDMQNESCARGGLYAVLDTEAYDRVIPEIADLLSVARESGIMIVHTQEIFAPAVLSPAYLHKLYILHRRKYLNATPALEKMRFPTPDSREAAIVEPLQPVNAEVVIRKHRQSAFAGTNLDLLLRSNGIETLVITGSVTEGCVDGTARDAHDRDYYVVVPRDAIASDSPELHSAALRIMSDYYDMPSAGEVREIWGRRNPSHAGSSSRDA